MMLLGMAEPRELPGNLKTEAGLTDEQVAAVIALANREVFGPLQAEMRKASAPPVRAQASSAPAAPIVPPPTLVTPVPPAPAMMVPTPAPVFTPRPVEPYIPPAPPVSVPIPGPLPQTPAAPQWTPPAPIEPTMRTMAHDVESMKAGAIPAPTPYHASVPPPVAPAVEPPAPRMPSTPEPRLVVPPPPSVPPSQVSEAPQLSRTRAATPVPDLHEVTSTLQKYGIDPYRETPE